MKANISAVGKNLTLSRGVTLNSKNTGVLNVISDPLAENSLTNVRASGFIYRNLQGQPFCADTDKSISYLKHYFNRAIRFFNSEENATLATAGDGATAVTSLSINVSTLFPEDVFILSFQDTSISDPEDTIEVNVLAKSWDELALAANTYFLNGGYFYPYNVSYENGSLIIRNMYNVATLTSFSLIKLSTSTSSYIAYVSDSDLESNFFEVSDSVAIIKGGLTLGTTPDQDMHIGSYMFVDDDEVELAAVRSDLDDHGTIKICLRAKNLTEPTTAAPDGVEVNEEIALYIAKDGTVWATAPDPVEAASGNEIATARWVRRIMAGGVIYKGPFDASAGNYSAISNSQVGWMYVITGAGVIGGVDWQVGDFLIVDQAGAAAVTKIDNTESADLVKLDAIQTLTNKTLTSPTLTGTPVTPTAAAGTNTTQVASTAFVAGEISALKSSDYFIKTGDVNQDVDGIKSWKKYISRKLQSYSPLANSNVVDFIYKVYDSSNAANIAAEAGLNRDTVNSAVRLKNTLYNINIGAATNFAGYDFVLSDTKGYYLEYITEDNTYNLGIAARDSSNKIPNTNWVQAEIAYAIGQAAPSAATTSALGLVKPDGTTITVDSNGVITAAKATASTLGIVKPDGTTITIDSNGVLSAISSGYLANTATGTNSLTILGTAATGAGSVNIGASSAAAANGTAVGYGAEAGNTGTVLGYNAKNTSNSGIAIGYGATTSAANTIQFGEGTNSTANSLQVGTYKLLDLSTGFIPDARLDIFDTNNKIKSTLIDTSGLGFVTTTGAQDITGAKRFQSGIATYHSGLIKGTDPAADTNARVLLIGDSQNGSQQDVNGLSCIQVQVTSTGDTKLQLMAYKNTASSLLNSAIDIIYEKATNKTYATLSSTPDSGDVSTKIATTEFVRNYQIPVTTISSTSGSVTLTSNNIYKITASGNMTFTLTTPTDSTVYNQIKVMLQTLNTPTIIWGTTRYYNGDVPDITTDGNYLVYFDWDPNISSWVCGSLTIPAAI